VADEQDSYHQYYSSEIAWLCAGLRMLSSTFLVYKKYAKMAIRRKVWHITAMKRSTNVVKIGVVYYRCTFAPLLSSDTNLYTLIGSVRPYVSSS